MTNQALFEFIRRSPSRYHAVAEAARQLEERGFLRLEEGESWQICGGGKYYVTRNGSSLIAFRVPKGEKRGFMLSASHSDSPAFRLREDGQLESAGYLRLSVERYGGMICASWLDRPLSLAGRLLVKTPQGLESRLVELDQDLMIIPHVAIHMDRKVNEGKTYAITPDMLPLYGMAGSLGVSTLLAQKVGVEPADVLGMDVYVYNRQSGTLLGAEQELIAAPRLDDLQCAFACLRGFLQAEEGESIPVYCLFDNEEVGSETRQGAASTLLSDTLQRINTALGGTAEDYCRRLANSLMVSADNAHAVHPNHPELADVKSRPMPNGGVVVKIDPRYATDGVSAAAFRSLCQEAGVPVQRYENRADLPGGSTLGNISAARVPVRTVDVGLAQLAMHSAFETAGSRDTEHLLRVMKLFFSKSFAEQGDSFRW